MQLRQASRQAGGQAAVLLNFSALCGTKVADVLVLLLTVHHAHSNGELGVDQGRVTVS